MGTVVEKIHEDMKDAMRSGDLFRRDTLRFAESALKNVALEKRKSITELSDEEVFSILRRSVKQREESAVQYRAGNRFDLAEKESKESSLLASYLPIGPSHEMILEVVQKGVIETKASSMKDMGKLMGYVMKIFPNANGTDVRRVVEEVLG